MKSEREKKRDANTPRSVPSQDAGIAARSRVLTVEGLRMERRQFTLITYRKHRHDD
jgi:hypothetical protein